MAATGVFLPAYMAAGLDPRVHWRAMHRHWCAAMWSLNMAQLHFWKVSWIIQLQHQNACILHQRAIRKLLAPGRSPAVQTGKVADASDDAGEDCKTPHPPIKKQQQDPIDATSISTNKLEALVEPLLPPSSLLHLKAPRLPSDPIEPSDFEPSDDDATPGHESSEPAQDDAKHDDTPDSPGLAPPDGPSPTRDASDIKAVMEAFALEEARRQASLRAQARDPRDAEKVRLWKTNESGGWPFNFEPNEVEKDFLIQELLNARPEIALYQPNFVGHQLYKYDPEDMFPEDMPYCSSYHCGHDLWDSELYWDWRQSLPEDLSDADSPCSESEDGAKH